MAFPVGFPVRVPFAVTIENAKFVLADMDNG